VVFHGLDLEASPEPTDELLRQRFPAFYQCVAWSFRGALEAQSDRRWEAAAGVCTGRAACRSRPVVSPVRAPPAQTIFVAWLAGGCNSPYGTCICRV